MLEGVPPNMSVSTSTPWPASAAVSASPMASFISSTDCPGIDGHRVELGRIRHDQAQGLQELLAQAVVRHDHDADAHWLLSTSRCSTFTSRPAARNSSASAFATATERWRPPVQPMPIVR